MDHGAAIRRATYLCLDYAKNVDKNWNITVSFIIHVNFDHAWAEHYPVTLITKIYSFFRELSILTIKAQTSSFFPSFPFLPPSFVSSSSSLLPLPLPRPLAFSLSSASFYSRVGSPHRPPPPRCRCPPSDPSFSSLAPRFLVWVRGVPRQI